MNSNKRIAITLGGVAVLLTLGLVVRFVVLSQYGFGGSWMYLGLPFGGIGIVVLLLRLGVMGAGQRSGNFIQPGTYTHYVGGAQPTPSPFPVPASAPQRLQDLENLRAHGAISDAEYAARRQQIISSI